MINLYPPSFDMDDDPEIYIGPRNEQSPIRTISENLPPCYATYKQCSSASTVELYPPKYKCVVGIRRQRRRSKVKRWCINHKVDIIFWIFVILFCLLLFFLVYFKLA